MTFSVRFFPRIGAVMASFSAAIALNPSIQAQEAPPALVGDGELLKPQFFPGKVYSYLNETTVTMHLPSPDGNKSEREVKMAHQARLVTGQRPGGESGTEIDASTERFQFTVTTPNRELKYDSNDEETKNTPLGKHFESARLRTVTMQLDESPRIVSSEEKGGGGPATPMPGMPQFGPDELKQMVASLLQGFPPDPVKPGSEWTQKGQRSLGQFGEVDFEITYRYVGDQSIDGAECAVIEFSGGMKGDVAVSGGQVGGAGGKLDFEGKGLKGKMVYDKLRHTVRETSQTVDMTVDMPNPDPTSTGKLRLPIKQQVSVKLVSVSDA